MNRHAMLAPVFINGIHHQEYAKLHYGRLLWRNPAYRERLLRHWNDPRHPHAERFAEHETDVRHILESPDDSDAELDVQLPAQLEPAGGR